jgi:hypothetical protein
MTVSYLSASVAMKRCASACIAASSISLSVASSRPSRIFSRMLIENRTGSWDTTLIWLQNKLGSTTHLWSFSSTVVSQYTVDKLKVIRDNFVTLDSLVKLKFFLTLFYIPRRNMEEVIRHFLQDFSLIFLDFFFVN